MLGSSRGRRASAAATYAVVWANLCNQYPRLRTVLVTGASERDDATAAALGLAEAAVRADRVPAGHAGVEGGGHVLVILLDPHQHRPVESPVSSVRTCEARSPAEVHSLLSGARDEFGLAMIVAPAPQTGPDCVSVAGAADAAVIVATSGRTRFAEAQLASSLLRQVGVTVAAALLQSGRGLPRTSPRAGAARVAGDGQRAGYGERPAPKEIAG